ncbi:uroporphyrinogen decarboxylase [Corynebacterium diphtheriae bv. mitis]|uniref:Uroporphyrinogen decarboxylase n=1 Tax=Corynebacterium diphtheriae bv. gravis TaxID=1720349 RepID=A0AAX0J2W9_CORDP|nr:uroporphyrinogen decarboxylase [Corynebacterium diphtheriae]AEX41092.1 uroporphyrinogen decarboxylase [Corynebacterium diphtheriae 31A]AEX43413.1 uroporphyrinogen decarboxylase [Corynebacterium diphtheriae 241]AEX66551.1 uroporphyrinogen decarboxylase [Corynebacterium diphtheriae C7 (beta)]AEX73600.1 uroporphyrinogen decarboxylase [Corynebacterium diphtheriae HC01]AEX75853.1 uroporphyrinogen decarboxylase [Corynebacterium diphtheriae HC02]
MMVSMPNPILDAAAGVTPHRRPVWFMRQAGRSLPEYREIREGVSMLDSCFRPDMLAEITLQPVRRHDVDAAILFSDIVVPLKAAGVRVEIVPGRGPVMDHPLLTRQDIENLPILDHDVHEVAEGIGIIREELNDAQTLIGFAGAPFTLASYLVEGGPSKNHEKTKSLMHQDPESWHLLMQRLVPTIVQFLRTQIDAGVQAMQLFDSWAGFLSERDYREFVLPYSMEILAQVGDVPRIHFGVGTGELLTAMSEAGSEVVGVDWRVPLDVAAQRMVSPKVLQGNLDPAILFAGEDVMRREIARICAEADRAIAAGHATGHIFNLGHGVLPNTDPDAITRAVEIIHTF